MKALVTAQVLVGDSVRVLVLVWDLESELDLARVVVQELVLAGGLGSAQESVSVTVQELVLVEELA